MSGSLKNYVSSDEVLTEFEIEETTKMVKKWIKHNWFIPSTPRAIILLDSSSESDSTSRKEREILRRLRKHKSQKPERKLIKSPSTSIQMRRPAPKVKNFDLFCDASESDKDDDESPTL